jgi:hypothetical protein
VDKRGNCASVVSDAGKPPLSTSVTLALLGVSHVKGCRKVAVIGHEGAAGR